MGGAGVVGPLASLSSIYGASGKELCSLQKRADNSNFCCRYQVIQEMRAIHGELHTALTAWHLQPETMIMTIEEEATVL